MKTNINGLNRDYTNILNLINQADEIINYSGSGIQDMMYFGLADDKFENEYKVYKNIDVKLKELKSYLEEIIVEKNIEVVNCEQ